MSGIEIVGIVLGALPLLIEGLKTYHSGLETASNMIKFEKTIDNLTLHFRACSSRYLHSCERLIRPLMLENAEWSELVDNPGGPAWRSQSLGSQLQDRLGTDFGIYVQITQRLYKRLIKFATKLDLDPQNGMKASPPKWLTQQAATQQGLRWKIFNRSNQTWKGLKIGFENGSLEEALRQIEGDLSLLSTLLDANEREAPARMQRKRRSNVQGWQHIRDAARSIYGALAAEWGCSHGHGHSASLKLEIRNAAKEEPTFRFGIILTISVLDKSAPSLIWHELEIEPRSPAALPQSKAPVQIQGPGKVPPTVRFFAESPAVTVTPSTGPTASPISAADKIENLCNWQQNKQREYSDSLGFLEYQLWYHRLFKSTAQRPRPPELQLLPLRDCLSTNIPINSRNHVFSKGFRPKEKYHLAATLASSVLQLAETPWLSSSSWYLGDVYFMELHQRALTSTNIYVQRQFPASESNIPKRISTPLIDNDLVFALGVVLIELSYQEPLSNFKLSSDLDPQGRDYLHTDLQVALRLVKDLSSMEGEKYAEVAWRCIKCNFEARERSLDNADFQEQFYSFVVQPLQELRDSLDGKP